MSQFFLHRIRIWDRVSAERVDVYLANSFYIQQRIEKYYGKKSQVLHPPVQLSQFKLGHQKREGALAVGRFINYKRFDLSIQACIQTKMPLKIIGEGPEESYLKKLASKHSFIQFLGKVSQQELQKAYQEAEFLIFPQQEDFGIVPLEAMASGTPVLAYGAGGALETVKKDLSGIFFKEQSIEALSQAIEKAKKHPWKHQEISESVQSFNQSYFRAKFRDYLLQAWHDQHRD